uniref:PPUP9740 n=1 Tax=Poeciliopsis prolifica TaxID=188132 RepID=A0A0S7JWZ3_9TELE
MTQPVIYLLTLNLNLVRRLTLITVLKSVNSRFSFTKCNFYISGSSQESNLDLSAVSPEPSCQTEDNSTGEEAFNRANVNGDEMNNIDQTAVSIEQQQQDPPAEQDSDKEGESGQKSESEETEPTAEGPDTLQTETSLPKSTREDTHDTDSAES